MFFSSLHWTGDPRIDARVTAGCNASQPFEVVIPTMSVRGGRLHAGQLVLEAKQSPFAARHQLEDDGRRPRPHRAVALFPAPCVDQLARRIDLHEFAAGGM